MKPARWMKTAFACARSSSVATRVALQEPTKQKGLRMMNGILIFAIVGLLIAPNAKVQAVGDATSAAAPTSESVLAAEEEFARALQDNDVDGVARSLSDDWAVVSARGGVAEGKAIFPDGIKQGYLTHKTYEVSEPRVRLYGNVALVTAKVHNAGTFGGKPFDVMERETDVWLWKGGGWKCVLTQEAWEGAESTQRQLTH
jgi:ketosteroid isomerase-like protein